MKAAAAAWGRALEILLASSLCAGLANLAVGMLASRPRSLPPVLAAAAVGVALVFAAQAGLLWLLRKIAGERLAGVRLAAAQGCSVIVLAGAWPLLHLLGAPPAVHGLAAAAVLGGALLVGAFVYRLEGGADRLGPTLEIAAPLAALELAVFVWLHVTGIRGAASRAALLSFAALAAVLVATFAVAHVLRQRRALAPLALLFAAVVVSPLAALWTGPREPARDAPAGEGPSVLLLTVDTLRADALRPGAGRVPTPALDSLAADSLVFTDARSEAPWTRPAFATMLTGLSPLVHRANGRDARLSEGVETLAERLAARGYRTVAIGSNPALDPVFNLDQGFSEYRFFPRPLPRSIGGRVLGALAMVEDPGTEELTDQAIRWLDSAGSRPFFLWLHYFDPHLAYSPPPEFLGGATAPPRIGASFDRKIAVRTGHFVPTASERRWIEKLYRAEIEYVDASIGRLLDHLRASGRYGEILVVFSSDHGEEFWEHGGFEHGHTLYDELLRVPLMFKLPAGGARGELGQSVSTGAVTPTLLDLLGIEASGPLSSPSLARLWREGAEPPVLEPIVGTGLLFFEERIALVEEGRKYIVGSISGREELYDLRADPGELSPLDLAAEEADRARGSLAALLAGAEELRRRWALEDERTDMDLDLRRRLEALGYLQ